MPPPSLRNLYVLSLKEGVGVCLAKNGDKRTAPSIFFSVSIAEIVIEQAKRGMPRMVGGDVVWEVTTGQKRTGEGGDDERIDETADSPCSYRRASLRAEPFQEVIRAPSHMHSSFGPVHLGEPPQGLRGRRGGGGDSLVLLEGRRLFDGLADKGESGKRRGLTLGKGLHGNAGTEKRRRLLGSI